jgi:tetratricopeptide (TPR) repeat protein
MRTLQTSAGLLFLLLVYLFPAAAYAQDPGQQEKLRMYSLYYEDFKNKNYVSALPPLRWILINAPSFPNKTDRNFERAVETYAQIGLAETDSGLQRTMLDSAIVMLDTAVAVVREDGGEIDEFEWALKKGKFIFDNLEFLPDLEPEIAAQYRKAWELEPKRLDPYYLEYILAHALQNSGDKAATITFLDEINEHRGDEEAIISLQSKWRGAIFTSPEERYTYVQSELEKDPDNIEMLTELVSLATDLDYRSDVYDYGSRLLELAPSADTYRMLGTMKLSDGEIDGALADFQKALELAEDPDDRRDVHYNMATAEQQLGRLSRARTNFRQALDIDPSFGRALIGIGDLYVTAISNCGTFEREDRAVYWLATDYFTKAKSVDPSLQEAADQRVRQYRTYYPDAEALFFMKWTPGDRYQINSGCYSWINEATTVRTP